MQIETVKHIHCKCYVIVWLKCMQHSQDLEKVYIVAIFKQSFYDLDETARVLIHAYLANALKAENLVSYVGSDYNNTGASSVGYVINLRSKPTGGFSD